MTEYANKWRQSVSCSSLISLSTTRVLTGSHLHHTTSHPTPNALGVYSAGIASPSSLHHVLYHVMFHESHPLQSLRWIMHLPDSVRYCHIPHANDVQYELPA